MEITECFLEKFVSAGRFSESCEFVRLFSDLVQLDVAILLLPLTLLQDLLQTMRFGLLLATLLPLSWAQYIYQTRYFEAAVDNFAFSPNTYEMRYFINDTFWTPEAPIFFYTGNEGDLSEFASNSGFVWEVSQEFGAMTVFAEHRYYGQSMPFGNSSYDNTTTLQYLTSAQALADYSSLLRFLRQQYGCSSFGCPTIAFGGSYGGMLSAFWKIREPLISGAIAASAPLWMMPGLPSSDPTSFNAIVTNTFATANPYCAAQISDSWAIMAAYGATENGRTKLQQIFNFCTAPQGGQIEDDWFPTLANIYGSMAMGDYPAAANFLGNLPAWPVSVACENFTANATNDEILASVAQIYQLATNYTGQAGPCVPVYSDVNQHNLKASMRQFKPTATSLKNALLDNGGWGYQSCFEFIMPIGQYGPPIDMMYPAPWDEQAFLDGCQQLYGDGAVPEPDWAANFYDLNQLSLQNNIFFSNGDFDPCVFFPFSSCFFSPMTSHESLSLSLYCAQLERRWCSLQSLSISSWLYHSPRCSSP